MKDNAAVYQQKLKEYESLMRYAARRYRIQGVLDPDDLYQEACVILYRMFLKYDFDENSVDFRKMFKTELWHGLSKVLHRFKTKKRDHTKPVRGNAETLENEGLVSFCDQGHPSPEDQVIQNESVAEVDKFLETLIMRLDDEALVVLYELLYPRSWLDVPDSYKANVFDDKYWRAPKKVPQHVVAGVLGLPLIRVRRTIKRIRREAVRVGEELGLKGVAALGFTRKYEKKSYKRKKGRINESTESILSCSVL